MLAAAAADPDASDIVRAHLGHLVFSFRTNRTDQGYLRLARHAEIELINQYPFAVKAHQLGTKLGDSDTKQAALDVLLSIVDDVIAKVDTEPEGGTFLLSIRQYQRLGGDLDVVRSRADSAYELFNGDWHLQRELALYLASLQTDAAGSERIIETELQRLIEEADGREGMIKEALLREVLTTARAHGLRSMAGTASSKLAEISPDDYDLKRQDITVQLDPEQVQWVAETLQLLRDLEPNEAWKAWAAITPDFLPVEEREPYVFRVVDHIATLSLINRSGHVSFTAQSDDDIISYRHHEHDRFHYSSLYSLVIGPGLQILLSRQECRKELERQIAGLPVLNEAGQIRVRRAYEAFLEGDSLPIGDALPTHEGAVRQLAISAKVSIYNASGSANSFKLLRGLISDLTARLGSGAKLGRFWSFALTDQLGYNIRNDFLHGFSESLSQLEATAVLQIYGQIGAGGLARRGSIRGAR